MNAARAAIAASIVLLLTQAGAAWSQEPPAGAAACSGCHPANSGVESPVPRLYGRKAEELAAAMAAFRSGARPSTVMDRIAKGFSSEETAAIAAWLQSQR